LVRGEEAHDQAVAPGITKTLHAPVQNWSTNFTTVAYIKFQWNVCKTENSF